ncbi:hypothetical protein Ana3638_21645 [Anaerocolumna sedimenticola]|uniref:Uncharacterized protein n=1 Tax=Anaerocolumna sedimenticola TaxID=2696063 RepID=A0A6P1TP69_9FIRM|nr:hypothetical protein [Anaerocolumna sedimenticola]QHQ63060.1 hypothetical protein Ana3638_21645 [Anaerocolumna sedimenticola]
MEELYLETKNGNIPIDEDIVEKYDLKKGTRSPFTNNRILGENGDYVREDPPEERASLNQGDDEIEDLENGLMLSQSEMIDIAQGVDSDT